MDRATTRLDFAVIGHQESWAEIGRFMNAIRLEDDGILTPVQLKSIYPFIPPRDIFRVRVKSVTRKEINGVYIETFLDPGKLDSQSVMKNIGKVTQAINWSKKMGARVVALGGFTSIVLEGNLAHIADAVTKFTTGNTLTAAYIVKGIEKAAKAKGIQLENTPVLIIGATGDIGLACVNYFKNKAGSLRLCARNNQQLTGLAAELRAENVKVTCSTTLEELLPGAGVIIAVASSSGLPLSKCLQGVLVCDAGYPKCIGTAAMSNNNLHLFHGGMGKVSEGFTFNPDYSKAIYQYPAPYIIHGCILEAMVLAFEDCFENYSAGKGNITIEKMEAIYKAGLRHGIDMAPFYNAAGLWS